MNGYNFTDHFRTLISVAREEAIRRQHELVGTEHLLLGLLIDGGGVGAAVLRNLGADLHQMSARLEQLLPAGNPAWYPGPELSFSSAAKRVLELSMAEARDLRHAYVGSEHLLLGLLREERGIAAEVLRQSAMSTAIVRAETLTLLGAEPAPGPE
jgi:ATP-dependent Clp protease ATP-binding subunit ClpC